MAFLLSLQDSVVSPFRAVDEFDVHMDPQKREMIFRMIFSHVKRKSNAQHIVITPSQLTILDKDVNLIFVQNTGGGSEAARGKME